MRGKALRRKKWKRKNKYISAYKGKDEWLETLEYEEALKERMKVNRWQWFKWKDTKEKDDKYTSELPEKKNPDNREHLSWMLDAKSKPRGEVKKWDGPHFSTSPLSASQQWCITYKVQKEVMR